MKKLCISIVLVIIVALGFYGLSESAKTVESSYMATCIESRSSGLARSVKYVFESIDTQDRIIVPEGEDIFLVGDKAMITTYANGRISAVRELNLTP